MTEDREGGSILDRRKGVRFHPPLTPPAPEEADGEAPDFLEDARELAVGAEQGVDLCADANPGETRGATGVGPFVSWCSGRSRCSLRIYTGDKTQLKAAIILSAAKPD